MRRHCWSPVLSLLLLLAVAACGTTGDDPADDDDAPPAGGSGGRAPVLRIVEGEPGDAGVSVAEALGHQATDDIVAVTGALFVAADGSVLLCDAIAESFPPQCGGARIAVDGLVLDDLELQEANGVRWSEGVTALGSVE